MRGQKKLDMSGTSRMSLLDAALGIGAGLVVPFAAGKAIDKWVKPNEPTHWSHEYALQLAAGVGIITAIPIYYFRGLGPALIAGGCALTYGLAPWVSSWLDSLGTGSGATEGALASRAALGRLQAARQRAMGRLGAPPSGRQQAQAGGALAGDFQGTAF
jgi:hypothetical protein